MNKILLSAFAAAAAIWASSARGDVFVPAQSGNLAVGGVENDAKDRISDLTENAARRHDGKAKTADATGDAGRKAKDGIAQDAAASVSGSGLTWLHDRRRNPGDVAGKRDTLAGPVAKVVL